MRLLIKNGLLVDPVKSVKCHLLIENGLVQRITQDDINDADTIINAEGKYVFPGLVDMHCHLREPGFEYKEDIESGTRAAAAGGFTSIACMPNTQPVNDSPIITKYIIDKAGQYGYAHVYPIGSISKGSAGEELSEIGKMAEAGVKAVSDDGRPVTASNLMRLAMLYADQFGVKVISHCEDISLVNGGVMDDCLVATELGLRPNTRAAEECMIARDLILARTFDVPVHIAHVSTAGGVQLIRDFKAGGVKVTAETAPHYIAGTSELCRNYNTMAKVNPPLRSETDKHALRQALRDGTIDCIATDHAPHHADEKNIEFDLAAFGISGFETAFSLCYTHLVANDVLSINKLVEIMSVNPAKILGINAGIVAVGQPADITIADPDRDYVIQTDQFLSKGKNNPFNGQKVRGKILCTVCGGKITYEEKSAL